MQRRSDSRSGRSERIPAARRQSLLVGFLALSCILLAASPALAQTLVLSPNDGSNFTGSSHTLTAVAWEDLIENIVAVGVTVTFEVTQGPHAGVTGTDVTDANGQATFTYTGTLEGRDTIVASFDFAGETIFSNEVCKRWVNRILVPTVNYLGELHTVYTWVFDAACNPQTGSALFTIIDGPNAGTTGTGVIDPATGRASFTYTSTLEGTDVIQASFGQLVSEPTFKTWVLRKTITLSPESAANPPGTPHTVTATVLDQFGNPAAEEQVTIEIVSGPHAGLTDFPPLTGFTDANGQISYTYQGVNLGIDTLRASFLDGAEVLQTATATKTWRANEGMVVFPAAAVNLVDSDHTVTATLEDANGVPVVDRSVTFQILSGPNEGRSFTTVTDGSGEARFTYSSARGGTDRIRVSFLDFTETEISSIVSKTWVYPEQILLAPSTQNRQVETTADFVATLSDSRGTPIVDRQVVFEVISGPNAGITRSIPTDDSGRAGFSYLGSDEPGTDRVRAYFINALGDLQATPPVTVTWVLGESASLSPTEAANPVNTEHTVTATVVHSDGNPVAGVPVRFEVVSGPNAGKTHTESTCDGGLASFSYVGEGGVGTDAIVATFVDSLGQPKSSNTVRKDWFYRQSIALAPASAVNRLETDHLVTATVTDETGAPIQGVAVTFTVTQGPNQGITDTLTTATDGTAVFRYTGSGGTGTDAIVAVFVDPFENTLTAAGAKTWVGPESIELVPTQAVNEAGTEHTVTAVVLSEGTEPVAGRLVVFQVVSGPNGGLTGSASTDETGRASFTYTGSGGPGVDTIQASFVDLTGQTVVSEPATKAWTVSPMAVEILLPAAAGSSPVVNAYRMITLPVSAAQGPDTFETLRPFFGGAADPFLWRVFTQLDSPSSTAPVYREVNAPGQDTLRYGKGWWIISADAVTIRLFGVPLKSDFSMAVGAGYRLIGCPFADLSVNWDDVVNDPLNAPLGLGSVLYDWQGGGDYVASPALDPGKAYWFFATNPGTLYVRRSYAGVGAAAGLESTRAPAVFQPPPPPAP